MASLVYLGVRPERGAADAEYRSFQRSLGTDLARIDLLTQSLSDAHLDEFSGFVIGGSPFNVTNPDASEVQLRIEADLERLAARALEGTTHAMFTCYGIGVVTRMLGGTVNRAFPEPTSATVIHTTIAGASDPVFGPSGPSFQVFTAHNESTAQTPPGAVLLAGNEACPVHAYRAGTHLYATQFHPEPSGADFADRMEFYRAAGYFDPAAFDAVADSLRAAPVTEGEALLRRFGDRARGV